MFKVHSKLFNTLCRHCKSFVTIQCLYCFSCDRCCNIHDNDEEEEEEENHIVPVANIMKVSSNSVLSD